MFNVVWEGTARIDLRHLWSDRLQTIKAVKFNSKIPIYDHRRSTWAKSFQPFYWLGLDEYPIVHLKLVESRGRYTVHLFEAPPTETYALLNMELMGDDLYISVEKAVWNPIWAREIGDYLVTITDEEHQIVLKEAYTKLGLELELDSHVYTTSWEVHFTQERWSTCH